MTESSVRLPWKAVLLLLLLSGLWGGNMVAIKVSVEGFPPVFAAALRSAVASACVYLWMRARGVPILPPGTRGVLGHGLAVGLLFGLEFGCIYLGLRYTLASRTSILLYTHPFFVALGAHYLLSGDRLRSSKAGGLVLAFGGIVLLFVHRWGAVTARTLPGDLLVLLAAALWAATTLYIKRYLTGRAAPVQTLFYQLAFSVPVLAAWSALAEGHLPGAPGAGAWAALAYQCFVVAFLSYLAWFELIDRYPVSLLAAFTFFTPVFGVVLSALLLPGEALSLRTAVALALVCAGTVLVNRPQPKMREPERQG